MQASNRPQAAQEIYFLRVGILDDVLRKQIFNVCVDCRYIYIEKKHRPKLSYTVIKIRTFL